MAVAENQPLKNRVNTTSFTEDSAPLRALSDKEFARRALELFAFQFETNRPYRRICEVRNQTPENIERWQDIPAMPTVSFKEFEFSCIPPGERTAVFHSSGTTQQNPSRHFHNAQSLAIYEESLLKGFRENVVEDGPVTVLSLIPPSRETPHSSLVHMFETARRELGSRESTFFGSVNGSGDWILDFERWQTHLRPLCDQGQPICILGTAFLFVHLLDYLHKQGLSFELPPGSVIMETGGYKGRSRFVSRSELHGMMCDRMGVNPEQIICEYGMSELSSQAYARVQVSTDRVATSRTNASGEQHRIFDFPRWCRVQIISPETGAEVNEDETGLIRVFDLANVYSIMAVQTEDLGIKRGNGFELIGRAPKSEARGCSLMSEAV